MTTRKPLSPSSEGKPAANANSLHGGLKALLSILLLWHLAAVFMPPFTFATDYESPWAMPLYRAIRPYADLLYLNHGYAFFAPDPGPSHLVRWKVEFADGRPAVEGRFPDLKEHRPRLLYHRHFMISEALHNAFTPPEPPPEPTAPPLNADLAKREKLIYEQRKTEYAQALREWKHRRDRYEAFRASLERHLLATYGGSKATIIREEHRQVSPFEFEELGMRIDDPATYRPLPETLGRADAARSTSAVRREDLPAGTAR